eukprot:8191108-Karenia_brevis.AAC.1
MKMMMMMMMMMMIMISIPEWGLIFATRSHPSHRLYIPTCSHPNRQMRSNGPPALHSRSGAAFHQE